jgi:thiol-disulfide isomerase/thioredoxin
MKKKTLLTIQRFCVLFVLLLITGVNVFAQKQTDILIGEKVPDISFTHLVNHTTKTAKLSDFAGKLVIIDFWNTGCSPCIKAFPKLDSMQKKFGNKIQIIAVAPENESVISDFVDRMKNIRHINLSFPFEAANKQLASVFKHIYVPHEVWIGPDGIVKATTDGEYVTAENINKALNGKAAELFMKTDRESRQFDWNRPLEIKRLGEMLYINDQAEQDTGLSHISVFTKYIDNLPGTTALPGILPRAAVLNGSLLSLYALAYGLQTEDQTINKKHILFEGIDSDLYMFPTDNFQVENWKKKHTYCYEVNIPSFYSLYPKGITKAMKALLVKEMGEIMQKDLSRFFGYQAAFEKRKEKCLVLSVTDTSKLFTRGEKSKEIVSPGYLGISFINKPLNSVFNSLEYYLQHLILLNETTYMKNVDIELNTKLTDWRAVAKILETYGLSLKEEERWMDMLIVSNKN